MSGIYFDLDAYTRMDSLGSSSLSEFGILKRRPRSDAADPCGNKREVHVGLVALPPDAKNTMTFRSVHRVAAFDIIAPPRISKQPR